MHNASFQRSDIPDLLINTCNQLRTLSLNHCDFGIGSVLEIDAPRSELSVLEILGCAYGRIDPIRAPKLCRVQCDTWYGHNPPVHFGCVPRLHTVSFAASCLDWQEPFALSKCLSNNTQGNLRIMHLDFRDAKIWVNPEGPKQLSPVFSTLSRVYLYNIFHESDLSWTLFVLEAAPSLEHFYIKISRHICDRYKCEDSAENTSVPWETSNFEHQNLESTTDGRLRGGTKGCAVHKDRHPACCESEENSLVCTTPVQEMQRHQPSVSVSSEMEISGPRKRKEYV